MAARSVSVHFNNNTIIDLTRKEMNLQHGEWTVVPPETIKPGQQNAQWSSESDGAFTGTQGSVTYELNDGTVAPPRLTIDWDNPFAGSNSYGITQLNGFKTGHEGGGGDNADVNFFIGTDR